MKIQLSDHFDYRRLLRFTFPSIVMMVFTSVYGVVDGFFVSNFVGKTPFAAVNFIMPFLMILGAVGFMFGTGGSAIIAITMGAGDHEKAKRLFSFFVYVSMACGAVIAVLGILFIRPVAALLGAYSAQTGFGLPAIGGKDSMSGTFNEIDVPPTLVSFAVDVAREADVISPELKEAGSRMYLFTAERDEYDLPVYAQVMKLYDAFHEMIQKGAVLSAYALDGKGLAAAVSQMGFGNKLGVTVSGTVSEEVLFGPGFGSLVAEIAADKVSVVKEILNVAGLSAYGMEIGAVNAEGVFVYREEVPGVEGAQAAAGDSCDCAPGTRECVRITMQEALDAWTGTLEGVFPTRTGGMQTGGQEYASSDIYKTDRVYVCRHKVAKPSVFIPVFPGTNCEYDSARAFARAGAEPVVKVFKNLSAEDIRDSVDEFVKAIGQAQMIMFPGGFSAGDEPEGSAKFFATAFRNEKMAEAVRRLLDERDGLALGICNGFQALIKLGLVPYGDIRPQSADSPTLTYNTLGRHISRMVYTKVVSDKSPWLSLAVPGEVYCNPASHGEGRFVATEEWLDRLFANGQVATQYVNEAGVPVMDEEWNINGSYRAVEGITSPDGRVLGKMAHSERRGDGVAVNIYGEQDLKLFESGVAYFR